MRSKSSREKLGALAATPDALLYSSHREKRSRTALVLRVYMGLLLILRLSARQSYKTGRVVLVSATYGARRKRNLKGQHRRYYRSKVGQWIQFAFRKRLTEHHPDLPVHQQIPEP